MQKGDKLRSASECLCEPFFYRTIRNRSTFSTLKVSMGAWDIANPNFSLDNKRSPWKRHIWCVGAQWKHVWWGQILQHANILASIWEADSSASLARELHREEMLSCNSSGRRARKSDEVRESSCKVFSWICRLRLKSSSLEVISLRNSIRLHFSS